LVVVGFYNLRNDESDRFDCWFDREKVHNDPVDKKICGGIFFVLAKVYYL
jgi:hypothetical protein